MEWQDLVFAVGGIILGVALIPMILENKRMLFCNTPYRSSIITAIIMYVYSFTYSTMGMVLTPVTTLIVAISWTIIAIQRWYYE